MDEVKVAELKLSDEEKVKLIEFYKANPTLWDTSDQYYKNKVKRLLIKKRLVELFEDKFSEEHLEKTFHSLRTSMSREVKKLSSGVTPKNKWKYFNMNDPVFYFHFHLHQVRRELVSSAQQPFS